MLNSASAKMAGLLLGGLAALGAFLASIMLGTTDIAWSSLLSAFNHYDPSKIAHIILLTERLPRALIAALVGASLAIAPCPLRVGGAFGRTGGRHTRRAP